MTVMEYTALGLCSVIFILGLLGSLLPIVPGTLIVWVGVITHRLWMGPEDSVTWKIVIIAGLLMLMGQIADFVLGAWGARKFGASWKGTVGAFIGAFIGFFIPPPLLWLVLGPIMGAVVGELAAGRTLQDGSKAGIGTVIGGILAFALNFGISLTVIALFFIDLLVA